MGKAGAFKELGAGIAAGAIGSALANQIPQNQKPSKIGRMVNRKEKDLHHHHKGKVKKFLYEDWVSSDDPDFNHVIAKKAFDLVMKMDNDTAEVFTHVVVSDMFEETVEKNLGTLQRHLDSVIAKRSEMLRRALVRVAKSQDDPEVLAYAQALGELTEVAKVKNQYSYGAAFKESDYNRDPGSGQFQVKITQHQKHPLHEKTAEAVLGIKNPKGLKGEDLTRFQDEYRQLASFLKTVNAASGGGGNQEVLLQYRDLNGDQFTQLHHGTLPPKEQLADTSTRLVGAIAKPTTLTAGGAAFGLAGALGGNPSPGLVTGINAAENKAPTFANQWLSAGDEKNSNARLYGRLAASGELVSGVAPYGSKAQLAGKFAQIVGQAGPQAEAVLGPTTRKTAYRYRGTEKTPEKRLVHAYAQGVAQGKLYGDVAPVIRELDLPGGKIREPRRSGKPGAAPAPGQMAQLKGERENRAPTWDERELGRRAVVEHLRSKMPAKSLYELQLASGNTPPSEGVIINADGQLVTQAIGYGDDHYLPFNLKNLKGLKGGEYIRTRSVGGLTSEDIYTALMMNARQVTVTSRSGTYTMTFEPDFRGGRRHNDKARRMTRRYEQLLDAVQSQQVDRIDIDPEMRQQIENEVKEEMSGPTWRRSDIQDAVRERIDEFKENPYITEQDEKRADAIINARAANASEPERAKIRAQVMDDLMDQKETKFRLNSAGYKGALDALQEQFPYYIAKPVRWTPPKDAEKKIDTALDRGYVEPGRNRPTAAAAGLFGAKTKMGYRAEGKFSAATADYQGARSGKLKELKVEVEAEPETSTSSGSKVKEVHNKRRAASMKAKLDENVVTVAQELQTHARGKLDDKSKADPKVREALAMTAEDLRDPRNQKPFADWAEAYTNLDGFNDLSLKRRWESAIGHRERKPYVKGNTDYPKQPPTFTDEAYELGAEPRLVAREIAKVDRSAKGSVIDNGRFYSQMSEDEHKKEHAALAQMYRNLVDDPTPLTTQDLNLIGVDPSSPALVHGKSDLRKDPKAILEQMELLQRSRALLTGLTKEDRDKLEQTKQENPVILNPTPTSEEQAKAPQDVERQIVWGKKVLRELESLRTRANEKLAEPGLKESHREALVRALDKLPDEDQTDQAAGVVATWDNHADVLRATDDFAAFNEAMKDDVDALMSAAGILSREKDHIEILLNPPRHNGS